MFRACKLKFDLPALLLMLVVASASVATLGFCCKMSIGRWVFWLVFALEAILAWKGSSRTALRFVLTVLACLFLTAYTFSYTGTDALGCWFPMQQMIKEGWNLVGGGSRAGIAAAVGDARIAFNHVFMYSKLVPLMGAIVGKATGIFAADSFLAYVLIVSLWIVAKRMASAYWGCSSVAAHVFAASVVLTTKIVAVMGGYVDYDVYAATLIAVFSLAQAWRNDEFRVQALICFALSEIILFSVKSKGIVFALTLLPVFAVTQMRANLRLAWMIPLAVIVCSLFLNLNPMIPVAQEFFGESKPIVDVTTDFTGNADAMRLGYFWRIVYAWVSPKLVPGNPHFDVVGGVGGFGSGFRFLLLGSLAAVLLSKKNFTTVVIVVLFVTANCLPLKYIGHARYCPQIWAIPMIAAFNLVYAPPRWFAMPRLVRFARIGCLLFFSAFALFVSFRVIAFWKKNWLFELARQQDLAYLRGQAPIVALADACRNSRDSYAIKSRLRAAGVSCAQDRMGGTIVSYEPQKFSFAVSDACLPAGARALAVCPMGDSPSVWFKLVFQMPLALPRPIISFD